MSDSVKSDTTLDNNQEHSNKTISDVNSVISNSETPEKPKFTIYRYKNRNYKIPTATMETFDCPGEVVDYIKECFFKDYNDDDDEHSTSSLCSNKDIYQ